MRSLADGLPPEIASQVHPDWYKNEKSYWSARERLLDQYEDQWVAFADGAVIASSKSAVEVSTAAHLSGKHPFVIRVGHENEPSRVRSAVFQYDQDYGTEALPVLEVEFRPASGTPGIILDRVIPDTGADMSLIPWADCQRLQLEPAIGAPSMLQGVGGGTPVETLAFTVWVSIDGQEIDCRLHADFHGRERILGRDVLNRLNVLFRGPAGEVVINP
ncbi:MAG TPA: hypothetical protein VGY55_19860 [Pirellulales bacterium]|jgi:predicted aspartyl protease|nr:hypothetical protein [Pirellulales bacterium]